MLRWRRLRGCWRTAIRRPTGGGNLAPLYSITSSADARNMGGTSSPSALAILRLIISSTLVTCWTGRSAGLSPFRMRP
jgi:hypothetical protein